MTGHHIYIVLAERAVPCKQLVEGVALSAVVVLLQQATGSSLVTMMHVHVTHAETAVIVHSEVNSELNTLQPSSISVVSTEYYTCTQTSSIALVLGLIVYQTSQRVVVVVRTRALNEVVTVVKLRITCLIKYVVTIEVLYIHWEQRRYELS